MGIHYFLNFALKHRSWVLVRTVLKYLQLSSRLIKGNLQTSSPNIWYGSGLTKTGKHGLTREIQQEIF